jgi:hypothetical protein
MLHGVQIVDLTFYTQDNGWALASADCETGPGRCTALLTTLDGRHWQSKPGAKFNVPGITGARVMRQQDPLRECTDRLRVRAERAVYDHGRRHDLAAAGRRCAVPRVPQQERHQSHVDSDRLPLVVQRASGDLVDRFHNLDAGKPAQRR